MDKKQTPKCGCGTTTKTTKNQTTTGSTKNQSNVNATRNNVKK